MIGGVSYIKNVCGILVVSSIENEFERGFNGGQIKEDLIIAKSCGIDTIIVAINKIDAIEYNKEKYEQIKDKINKFSKSLGFKEIIFIPISAWTGENIINKITNMEYDGLPLMELLNKYCIETENNLDQENEIKYIEKEKVATTMIFIGKLLPTNYHIIASGMTAIMYYNSKEYFIEFDKIYNIDKNQLILSTITICQKNILLYFRAKKKIQIDERYDKFIIRNGDDFIGFGNLIKK
jgi:sulfate adenylyltransferase subunit 1 (EFTu-like GTPase family)